jgi:hypothetical protein
MAETSQAMQSSTGTGANSPSPGTAPRTIAMMAMPQNLAYPVDFEYWSQRFNPQDSGNTELEVNTYIARVMRVWQIQYPYCKDEDLWELFQEDFEDFTEEVFALADRAAVRCLREHLVTKGVWVEPPKGGRSYAKALVTCLNATSAPEWSLEAIEEKQKLNRRGVKQQDQPRPRRLLSQDPPQPSPPPSAHLYDLPTSNIPSREVTNLTKIYTEEMKFSGEMYDSLQTKLPVFQDCCNKVGIHLDQYHHAFSIMLKGRAADYYYSNIAGNRHSFDEMLQIMRTHFETDERRQLYMSEWREITLQRVISDNPTKSRLDCLQLLLDKLQKIKNGLPETYGTDTSLRDQLVLACRGISECNLALYQPAATYEGVCSQLRSAIGTAVRSEQSYLQQQQFTTATLPQHQHQEQHEHMWVDRKYSSNRPSRTARTKTCFICKKPGCWSTKHPPDERRQANSNWRRKYPDRGSTKYQSFLYEWEGIEVLEEGSDGEMDQLMTELDKFSCDTENFSTELCEVSAKEAQNTVTILHNNSTFHAITKSTEFREHSAFTSSTRYSSLNFEGIITDTGAAGVSTAGLPQVTALQRILPDVALNISTAGQHKIRFGKGEDLSLGTIDVPTPLGTITFHVVPASTPFLFCIQDMDRMGVKLDNLTNLLIRERDNTIVPVVRKWGHPFMLLGSEGTSEVMASHLTETELRQLHRRFGHPSVQRLVRILQRAGHEEVEQQAIEKLTKFCHYCQMNSKSPGRFKFTLKDEYEFNYSVIVDIMYLTGKPVLHVIDEATAFQAARFLLTISAKETWEQLRYCWIDVYQGPPDVVITDAGKNFASEEFRQSARALDVKVKEVPVEAHNSIGKVERYHAPLRRAFQILSQELPDLQKELLLQMAVKAINDSAGPDGIVPTLLVFGAYPRITKDSPPNPSISARAEAVRKAMKEIQRIHAKRQINEALAMRNGPNTLDTINLPIQSDVRVWRDKDGWKGPYKLIAIDGETCTIQMPYGPTNFRSTSVKPYHADQTQEPLEPSTFPQTQHPEIALDNTDELGDTIEVIVPARRGRGRPRGSRNRAHLTDAFLSAKEKIDWELSLKLRKDGVITDPGLPFEVSDQKEVDALLARGVFAFEQYNEQTHGKERVFKSRIVREVKGKATPQPFEKSRLIIQGYNDDGKSFILTQSPAIQRASQRLIVALAPSLTQQKDMTLWLRDITQAYTQSATPLQRTILASLPKEIEHLYPKGTIMHVLRPLYGIAEAGTHWWSTYFNHHKDKLNMTTSTYDPCLLISSSNSQFGIVGMQTDDTLGLSDDKFAELEEKELTKASLSAKPKETLSPTSQLQFNGCILTYEDATIQLRQKGQGQNIQLIDPSATDYQQTYVKQRARGAYIASICQPEATFDLSVAAQQQQPETTDIQALNKRLEWQIDNLERGLRYISLDLLSAKLFVFVDASFANNKDLSSQIGFEVIIANESSEEDGVFELHGNLIHWSSTKCKRVTRSTLASEIYSMVAGTDIAFAISTTLEIITKRLQLTKIPTIVCTDSYSLYECLVKLGTTMEKRLMIDIMALRQSYERRELYEVRWINGTDNPADAMTKGAPNKALETFVDTNRLRVRVEGWVRRDKGN